MESIDKRKVVNPEKLAHMEKMREALRKKQQEKKAEAQAAKKYGKKKVAPPVIEEEEEEEESIIEEEEEEEQPPPKKVIPKKSKAAPVRNVSKPKDEEIYELGRKAYKDQKKKALFEDVRQFILQEFQVGGHVAEDSDSDYDTEPQPPRQQPVNNLLSIF